MPKKYWDVIIGIQPREPKQYYLAKDKIRQMFGYSDHSGWWDVKYCNKTEKKAREIAKKLKRYKWVDLIMLHEDRNAKYELVKGSKSHEQE